MWWTITKAVANVTPTLEGCHRLSSDLPLSPVPPPHKEVGHHDNRLHRRPVNGLRSSWPPDARLSDAIERPSVGMRHGPAPRISPNICVRSRYPECDLTGVLSRHHPPCASGVLPSYAVAVRQL